METTLFTTFSRTTEPRKRARTRLPADGRAPRGFTLTELLAVLAIVLIVVAGSISVWLAMAGAVAPGQATAVVQAMLNGARDCAVSGLTYKRGSETTYGTRPVYARVVFSNSYDPNKTGTDGLTQYERESGTKMSLQYWKGADPPTAAQFGSTDWVDWPGRGAEYGGRNLFVLDFSNPPPNFPTAEKRKLEPLALDDTEDEREQKLRDWELLRVDVCKALTEYAFTGTNNGYLGDGAKFNTDQDKFYMTFEPTGTLVLDSDDATTTLVIIHLAGQRVGEHQFYLLNANTGTQLVFE